MIIQSFAEDKTMLTARTKQAKLRNPLLTRVCWEFSLLIAFFFNIVPNYCGFCSQCVAMAEGEGAGAGLGVTDLLESQRIDHTQNRRQPVDTLE